MEDNEYGTPEERTAVRDALLALRDFNAKLGVCRQFKIECTLEKEGWAYYTANFVKRVTILPAIEDGPREPGTGWTLSEETKDQLNAIDRHRIR